MRRAVLALLLICATASPGRASPQSEALSARGLIALNAGDTRGALAYFERAVAADPQDAQARYQQAVARAKLGDSAGAIADFQAALALQPHFPAAALELGIALVDSGRFQEAEPWLTQAQSEPDLDAQASFFLGIAQLRLERYAEARQSFARARARDASLLLAAQFYDGVIAYRQGDTDAAQAAFEAVQDANPTSAMGRESTQYLALIVQERRATYSAFGTVALEYDSNVTLGPDNATLPQDITGEADGRFVINVGGRYVPLRRGRFSVALSYEFFQTLQFQLTDFNLQDHRPAVQLQYDFDRVSLGLLSRYDYYLLDSDSYLQQVTAFPWVSVREDGFGRTDLYYRMQWRDFYGEFQSLDGYYNTVGFRQFIDLGSPAQQFWFGYEFEPTVVTGRKRVPTSFDPPEGALLNPFQYTGQVAEVGVRWPLAFDFNGQAGYRFEYQKYDSGSRIYGPPDPTFPVTFPLQGGRRLDHDHRIVISLERPLPALYEHLTFVASWFGTWNDSNKTDFQYTRQIGSIGLQVRF